MQNEIEKQAIPTAQAIFLQGQGGRFLEIKRCGYCDRLVRWTSVEGRNVAVKCDGSRHQCLTDGTAKRKQPLKHARPSPKEVAGFLVSAQTETSQHKAMPGSSMSEPTCDLEITAMHQANVAAWKAQTEAMIRLADAMIKVAQSNNGVADSNRRLAKMYGRLAHAMERVGHTCR